MGELCVVITAKRIYDQEKRHDDGSSPEYQQLESLLPEGIYEVMESTFEAEEGTTADQLEKLLKNNGFIFNPNL